MFEGGGSDGRGTEGREPHGAGSPAIDIGRRRFVRLGGTTLLVGSAGCLSADDDGSDEEAASGPSITVTDASLSDTTVSVDESLDITGTVENRGDREGTFYAELRVNGMIVDTNDVTVDAGDTASVTFTGTFNEPGEYEASVNDVTAGTVLVELPPPEFEVVDTSMGNTPIAVDQPIDIGATIENVGGREGTFTAELRVDGVVVGTEDVTIDAGDTASVTFTRSFDEPGEYEVSITDATVGTALVEPPAAFEIVNTTMDTTTVGVGETVDVAAAVANAGGLEGTFTAELEQDGEPIATREVTVPPGETATAWFSVSFAERGAYPLSVNGVAIDTLYVLGCDVAVDETITVGSRSSQTYEYELKTGAQVTITATTRQGTDPTVTVVGPSGESVVDGVTDDSVQRSFTVADAGTHEIRFVNDALLPWQGGTWDVGIEICTW